MLKSIDEEYITTNFCKKFLYLSNAILENFNFYGWLVTRKIQNGITLIDLLILAGISISMLKW